MAQPKLDAGNATLLAKDAQGRPVHLPWRGVTQSPTGGWWTRLAIVPQEIGGMQMHEVVHIHFPDKCLSDPDAKHVQTSIAFMSEDLATEIL